MSQWLELRADTSRDAAKTVEYALTKLGALSVTLQDNADQAILEPGLGETPLWLETRVTGLFPAEINSEKIMQELRSSLLNASAFSAEMRNQLCSTDSSILRWSILEDKDWEREWMEHYKPIHCGGKLWICPSWTPPPVPEAVNLLLDPGLAFGTGTHPTTFLCLQWLAKQNLEGIKVLDFGCGSGILAIASLLMGVGHAAGIDIDPQALQASWENAERNNVEVERLELFFPEKFSQTQVVYDMILANILAKPLIELADQLVQRARPGALICLSGLLCSQVDEVLCAYEKQAKKLEVRELDGWACLVLRKELTS